MLMELAGSARDLARLGEIGAVLVRHGFGDAAQRLGIAHAIERASDALHWRTPVRMAAPQRVRLALQDLGPAFVKLGQLLATRVDLFAAEWIAEFEKLQDQAAPADPAQIRAQLVEDLGAEPEQVFAVFDPVPLAAGSIAQVHRARLADGTAVAVKVRRPGIRATVEADLSLLARLARVAETRFPDLARFHLREVVRRFTQTMRSELDLRTECRSAERVARNFGGNPDIVVPKVYWQWTRERVNVQEFIEGIPSRDPAALDRAGLDRRMLAHVGAQAMLKMVVEDGFFHADPHPGNLFYLPEHRIAFIDFGMTGSLSLARRAELITLLESLVSRDAEGAADILLEWAGPHPVDAQAVVSDIDAFVNRYHGAALAELDAGAMLGDLMRLLQEHKLALPPDLALVLKVCVTLERTGRELDAEFDMVGEAAPVLRAAAIAQRGPRALALRGRRAAAAALAIVADLPVELRKLLRSVKTGRMEVRVEVKAIARLGAQIDRAASRLTLGIVTAALIIGSSNIMTVEAGPTLFGLPFFGLAGFLGAVAGGSWLLVSIWRSGKAG